MRQNRHIARELCPPWLRGEQAYSFLNEGIFTLYDIDTELMWQGLLARFPSYCPADALPYLAADRKLITGPYESEAAVRARLRSWIDEAILAGLPLGWLVAMQAYLGPNYPMVRIVTRKNTWYTLAADTVPRMLGLPGYAALPKCTYELGAQWPKDSVASQVERARGAGLFTRHKASPANWDWDSISNPERSACWWDLWGFAYPTSYSTLGKFGGSGSSLVTWGSTKAVGFSEFYATIQTLKQIAAYRKSSKGSLRAIIFPPSLADFDPTTAPADPGFPDGRWGAASKISGGAAVSTKRLDCRYLLPPF
jgi:hypothetical protein